MGSLLFDDQEKSLLGIPGAQVMQIRQPDPDRIDQGTALAQTYNQVQDYIQEERRKSVELGLWDPETNMPTAKGVLDAGRQFGQNILGTTAAPRGVGVPTISLGRNLVRNAPGSDTIATRVPTSKKQDFNPHADDSRIIDLNAMRESPEAFKKNADLIREYPGLRIPEGATDEEAYRILVDHSKDNLRYLYDNVPDVVRERGPNWYVGGRRLADNFASEYDVLPRQVAAATAALSPQMVWDQNVSLVKRLMDVRKNQQDFVMTPEMSELIKGYGAGQKKAARQAMFDDAHTRFSRTAFGDLDDPMDQAIWTRAYDEAHNPRHYQLVTPEGGFGEIAINKGNGQPTSVGWGSFNDIAKAHSVLNDGSVENISAQMGGNHKVRNFYNNLVDPTDPRHVTIDTHAIAAANLMPLGGSHPLVEDGLGLTGAASAISGTRGLYGAYADAYRELAHELGILPRELQSVTWEGVRGLFSDVQKRDKGLVRDVNDIWKRHQTGDIDGPTARDQIRIRVGGIDPPPWAASAAR